MFPAVGSNGRLPEKHLPEHLAKAGMDATYGSKAEVAAKLSKTQADAAYAKKAGLLSALMAAAPQMPPVNPTPPTITFGSSYLLTTNPRTFVPTNGEVRLLGFSPLVSGSDYFNDSAGTGNNQGGWGVEFDIYGTEVEFALNQQSATGRVWFVIDGQLASAEPVQGKASTGFFTAHVALGGSAAWHRVKLLGWQVSIRLVRVNNASAIMPTPPKRLRIGAIGDSFGWASGDQYTAVESWPWLMNLMTDAEVHQNAVSGTGYTVSPTFGQASRASKTVEFKPDVVVIEGSGNDSAATYAQLNSAAAALYTYLNTNLPGVPVIVFLAMPRDDALTIAPERAKVLNAVRDAALAAPNVIGIVDSVGTIDPLPAYTTGATYAAGARVSYLGAVYQARVAISSAPATLADASWTRLSWYSGTGNSATPAGDGNRDTVLGADDHHPSRAGQRYLTVRMLDSMRSILAAA